MKLLDLAIALLLGVNLGVAALAAWANSPLTLVPVFYSERYGLPLLPFYAALAAMAFASRSKRCPCSSNSAIAASGGVRSSRSSVASRATRCSHSAKS